VKVADRLAFGTAMDSSWITQVHEELLGLRQRGPAWGNSPAGQPYVESTALAALALAGSLPERGAGPSRAAIAAAADWLSDLQQHDGALGIALDLPRPCWTTPLGILVWQAADRAHRACQKAVAWLLVQQGKVADPAVSDQFGHDPRIAGWPWVEGTHSWLEPTAMAVLALRRAGRGDNERTRDGERLIRDRVIRNGGWNYGNSTVFGADLRPHPAPTGLALLALAGNDDFDSPHVARSCAYLEKVLPTTRAPQSLCFGTLALAAWGRRPAAADEWIASSRARARERSNPVAQIAHLLLAAGSRSLEVLGVSTPARPQWNGQ
jgi:hypothetical protein